MYMQTIDQICLGLEGCILNRLSYMSSHVLLNLSNLFITFLQQV